LKSALGLALWRFRHEPRARAALAILPALARNAAFSPRFEEPSRTPLVTVVIPTYNWSSVLRLAVASALRQTYPRLEVVVVGDGCTDDSADVVAAFADSRVRWQNLERNSGSQSVPNNVGIELARGDLIAYHGHDDIWLPSHLARVVRALLDENADLAYSVTEEIGPRGSGYRELVGQYRRAPLRWIPPSSLIHRKSLVDEIGPWLDYRTIQEPPDAEFITRAYDVGKRFALVKALTVFKFNSAYRPNSYVEKPWREQALCFRQSASERTFVFRELVRLVPVLVRSLFRSPTSRLPRLPAPPDPLPPGWYVTQFRRIRGLEPGGSIADPEPGRDVSGE